MANPVWPVSLPDAPLAEGYQENPVNNNITTQMETGPAKKRRRYTEPIFNFICGLVLTSDEVDILETFYFTTLEGGTLEFDWKHPRTRIAATLRFKTPYTVSAIDPNNFSVNMSLERLPS